MAWNKRLCVRSDANVYVLYKGTFCALVSSGQHCHSVAVFSLCLRLSLNLNRNVDLEHMLPFFSFYLPKPKPTSSSVSSWFFYTSDSDKQRFDDFITIKKKQLYKCLILTFPPLVPPSPLSGFSQAPNINNRRGDIP